MIRGPARTCANCPAEITLRNKSGLCGSCVRKRHCRTHDSPLTIIQRTILAMVTEAAEQGLPCPSNSTVADTGICEPTSVSDALKRLEKMGHIKVHTDRQCGPRTARIVTVIATGKRTAGELRAERMAREAAEEAAEEGRRRALADSFGGVNRVVEARPKRGYRSPDSGRPRAPEPSPDQYVDRDACGFCGVRGDIHAEFGCRMRRGPA